MQVLVRVEVSRPAGRRDWRSTRLGNSSVTYRLAIFQEPDEAVAAVGHWVHVYVDRANRRPVPIPDAIRALLEKARVE